MTPATDPGRSGPELWITRVFDAPRALVFAIWTRPEHVKHWWGPRGYITISCEMDLRPGGAWRVRSRHEDGSTIAERGVFREVVEPERLIFTQAWDGDGGAPGHETLVTVTFAEEGSRTRMTFHQATFTSVEERDGHEQGWSEAFDMLAEHLERGDRVPAGDRPADHT
jgi:uncharacterized protein YndB with AHSA1/START domain